MKIKQKTLHSTYTDILSLRYFCFVKLYIVIVTVVIDSEYFVSPSIEYTKSIRRFCIKTFVTMQFSVCLFRFRGHPFVLCIYMYIYFSLPHLPFIDSKFVLHKSVHSFTHQSRYEEMERVGMKYRMKISSNRGKACYVNEYLCQF